MKNKIKKRIRQFVTYTRISGNVDIVINLLLLKCQLDMEVGLCSFVHIIKRYVSHNSIIPKFEMIVNTFFLCIM